jgi:hypothetical protein
MANNDMGSGPIIGQIVKYNNSGTIVPAVIYSIASAGTVNLLWFGSGGTTNVTGVGYDNNLGVGKWCWHSHF